MPVQRRFLLTGFLGLCLFASGPASALDVPPFKGNDTGGIIAWTLARESDAQLLAVNHCARYGKLVKRLATQPYYGGYISFACIWPRPVSVAHVLRVKY